MRTTSVLLIVACLVRIQGKNEKGLTLDQVLDKLIADLDKNQDDVVNEADISKELKTKWDSNGDGCLSHKEFEKQWVDSYHYDADTINLFFSRLDIDRNGCLNTTDFEMHRYAIDTNRDDVITVKEFRTFVSHENEATNRIQIISVDMRKLKSSARNLLEFPCHMCCEAN
ncbi:hypothetical protein ACJMK2_011651 [Sinanodonta woodiana]|uniref:Uncharacterized protein n=1 Tax=Sinanodonta woodiana TaxID=1069815 RepID=A0ABD3V8T0_SINWO